MAFIKIKTIQDLVEVTPAQAKVIAQKMEGDDKFATVSIGGMTFFVKDITAVLNKPEGSQATKQRISDMTTDQLKGIIGDWEQVSEEAIAAKPEKIDNRIIGMRPQGLFDIYVESGAIVDQGDGYWAIKNVVAYETLEKKQDALSELKRRRKFAKDAELKDFERIESQFT